MPLPKPREDEQETDFMSRCMENDTMNAEYPNSDQRVAVCASLWGMKKIKDALSE